MSDAPKTPESSPQEFEESLQGWWDIAMEASAGIRAIAVHTTAFRIGFAPTAEEYKAAHPQAFKRWMDRGGAR